MLAVITDDFTGASEVAGIALDKGYETVIQTRIVDSPGADVLVIATDMRSMAPDDAAARSATVTSKLLALRPQMIFKKVDSVLRGNIGPELDAQMQVEKKPCSLLVPANPSRRRTISNGIYYVEDTPIADSGFAMQHELGASTSNVVDILKNRGAAQATCISPGESIGTTGIYVGNTKDSEDVSTWADAVDDSVIPAGGADFFSAVLDRQGGGGANKLATGTIDPDTRALYLCGSTFPSSRRAVDYARQKGTPVICMPDAVYFCSESGNTAFEAWVKDVLEALGGSQSVIVAVTQVPTDKSLCGKSIARAMGTVAQKAVDESAIDELMIEGGATSQAVVAALQVDSLYPCQAIAPGITRMRADGYPNLHITMKPGSYRWPGQLWNF